MTPQQQSALEALVGRVLTAPEVAQLTPLVAAGATQAIASNATQIRVDYEYVP